LVSDWIVGLFLFVLSMFVGLEIIKKIPPTLHTPLMSGANAISGIVLVGALLVSSTQDFNIILILGFAGVILATINIVGGFVVTDRMLKMFRKKNETK
jgi:H+-translocating NAD(P) transhydrogenase subunit alpha